MPNQFELEIQNFRNSFQELVHSIKNKRIIFFVGSGISSIPPTEIDTAKGLAERLRLIYSGFPWWQEYFDKTRLSQEDQKVRFYVNPNDLPKLEEIAELFLRRGVNQYKEFIEVIENDQEWKTLTPNICHTVLSELMIEEICPGVITANQDNRIEIKHDEITTNGAINIVSHDDYRNKEKANNNIYKVNGCLFYCQTKKHESIWASSQFAQTEWPVGVKFGEDVFKNFVKQGYKIMFVGFKTYLQYLNNTITKLVQEGCTYDQFYCIGRRGFEELAAGEEEEKNFLESIQLQKQRYCKIDAQEFFRLIRYFVFDKMLCDLYQNSPDLKGDQLQGGHIPLSSFNRSKDSLKEDVLKSDREVFQMFMQHILHKHDLRKYVSFRYMNSEIGRLFFILAIFRFNYILNFCQTKYCHLIITKDNFEAKLIMINGERIKPLRIIIENINREMTEDFEMGRNIRNVFVYDALDYTLQDPSTGTGRMIEMASPVGKATNGYEFNYNRLLDNELISLLLSSLSEEDFKQKLDNISWRNSEGN